MDLQPGQAIQTKIGDQIQEKAHENNRVVYALKSIWPLNFFPDELIIREKNITVIKNHFLYSYDETILIKDIGETIVIDSFFSASLTVYLRLPNRIIAIKALPIQKARQAKIIIDELFMKESAKEKSIS